MPKSKEEQIAELDKKIEQLKARKSAVESRMNEQKRKARNTRLMQIGIAVESFCKCEINDFEAFEKFLQENQTLIALTQSSGRSTLSTAQKKQAEQRKKRQEKKEQEQQQKPTFESTYSDQKPRFAQHNYHNTEV